MTNINNKATSRKKLILIVSLITVFFLIIIACVIAGLSVGNNTDTNNIPYEDELKEGFDIETPYCTLSYPLKWKDEVKIEHIDKDVYIVEFYRVAEGQEDLHLFDIAFGGEKGDYIGSLDYENNKIDIKVISYDIGDNWTEDELDVIGDMLEDVNHIIRSLEDNNNFEGI